MAKRIWAVLSAVLMLLALTGCKTKTLHCDSCGIEVKVQESSNMEEDWIILCEDCNEDAFGDDPLLNPGS